MRKRVGSQVIVLTALLLIGSLPVLAQDDGSGESGEPIASPATAESMAPDPAVSSAPEGRLIELETARNDCCLLGRTIFTDTSGVQIQNIPVTPGETVIFSINNVVGGRHNFYIGTDEELAVPDGETTNGLEKWISDRDIDTSTKTLEWTVPDDITGLMFGCTLIGHYETMKGTFSVTA